GAEICMNKIIHVADSSRQAREDLREPVLWFFRTQAGLISDPTGVPPEQYKFYRRVRENLLSLSEEKALDQAAIFGDAEEVADKPQSSPRAVVGRHCHALRERYAAADWRIVYKLDADAVVILDVFSKTARAMPKTVSAACTRRLTEYDRA